MALQYKTKQASWDLKFNEKAVRALSSDKDFIEKRGTYLYIKKVWISVGPDKDYTRKKEFDGLKVVFQFGKGRDKIAHVTVHNVTKKGAKKVNKHELKHWNIADRVLIARAQKWAKNLGFTLSKD